MIDNYKNKIVHGDCVEIMKKLPNACVDLILTDPPYELNMHGGTGMGEFANRKLIKMKHIDFISHGFDYDEVFNQFKRICNPLNLYIFCSNAQISKIMSYFEKDSYAVNLLVWHKTNAVPLVNNKYHSNAEFIICVRGKGAVFNNLSVEEKSKVISLPYPLKNRIHPTQKPLQLIERLIRLKSNEGDLILDAFSGSGTTAIACHKLKRNFICMEKDYDFWKLSNDWLSSEQAQMRLF